MSAKHTPGPWETDHADHDAPHQDIKVKAGKQHTVCIVWIDDAPVREFNDQQEANARLIAAAPELLDALIELADCGTEAWGEDRPCVRIARAAIAKATNPD